MNDILREFNIELSDFQLTQLEDFFQLLIDANSKFNLTAIVERQEVFEKHFLDSILGSIEIGQNSTLCDVGSGAGFPAVPLKIARPDLTVTAIDSVDKKVGFLKSVSDKLGLNIDCRHCRVEDFAKSEFRQSFDVVTARAVAPLNVLLEYLAPLAKIGGTVLAYKTDDSEVESCKNAINLLGLKFESATKFTLPSKMNRCLLLFRKVSPTPSLYPRPLNKPRKNPL